ncbi:MAG: TonB-dependent receptor [Acidobacteria bacterium]|nr:TonB-dependent receptor [Acidobacteriota bacterium]
MRKHLFILLAIFFASSISVRAQTAELRGTVMDPKGAVVPGVTITVTNVGKSISRVVTSNEQGEYSVLSLPPSKYEVKAEAEGFITQVKKDVELTVGQIAVLDFQLQVGVATEVIEVTTDVQLVETERTQQANTIQERYIENLPINRRDYLDFTLLAPGIVDSDAFADNTDFRVAQTPQSGISFYGSNGRGNNIMVDGGEANDDAGGVRPTLSQEAVQEFQINRSNYTAEFGGASGGVINIVSKSGGNQFRGTLFGFFRHDKLDAADPFAIDRVNGQLTRVDLPGNRQQYGGSLSFPIKRDRTFFFGTIEKLNRDESVAVPVLTDDSIFKPTKDQIRALDKQVREGKLSPARRNQLLRDLTITDPNIIKLFETNSGVFPFTTNNLLWSVRLDHQLSDNDQLMFRYNFALARDQNQNLNALVAFSRGNFIKQFDSNAIAGWTHTFGSTVVNDLRAQWDYYTQDVIPNDPIGPELNVTGFGFFNRDIFLPSLSTQRHYQFVDNLSYSSGTHSMKFGGMFLLHGNRTESHTFLGGRFNFGPLPGFAWDGALSETTLTSLQALNFGFPQFYQQGFGDPTVEAALPFLGVFAQDSWKIRPNFTLDFGLRYELDDRRDPLPTDKDNFAPRVGFAWDPFRDGKTTIRGGYGIFYSPIYFQIDYVVNALNAIGSNNYRQIAQIFVPLTGAPDPGSPSGINPSLSSAVIFNTLRAQGVIGIPTPIRTITPEDLAQFGIPITHEGLIPPLTVLFPNSQDYANAYAQQTTLGIERQIGMNWGISASYIFSRTINITRSRDINLLPAPVGPLGIRQWNLPQCGLALLPEQRVNCFVDRYRLQQNIFETTARAFYHGFIAEVNRRFSNHLSLSANYTFSKAIDEVTDFNSDFQPNDQTNLRAERALSPFDQRHKAVAYAALESPFPGGSEHPAWSRFLSGFMLTPIFRYNSGRPFNLLTGADINGDRHSTTDRPPFAGRNTGKGPDYWAFDIRLTRRIGLGSETRFVELMFEAFNLFNHLNYGSVNNTVVCDPDLRPPECIDIREGDALIARVVAPPFDLKGRKDRGISQPLGFTSSVEPRRIQLGFRLNF